MKEHLGRSSARGEQRNYSTLPLTGGVGGWVQGRVAQCQKLCDTVAAQKGATVLSKVFRPAEARPQT